MLVCVLSTRDSCLLVDCSCVFELLADPDSLAVCDDDASCESASSCAEEVHDEDSCCATVSVDDGEPLAVSSTVREDETISDDDENSVISCDDEVSNRSCDDEASNSSSCCKDALVVYAQSLLTEKVISGEVTNAEPPEGTHSHMLVFTPLVCSVKIEGMEGGMLVDCPWVLLVEVEPTTYSSAISCEDEISNSSAYCNLVLVKDADSLPCDPSSFCKIMDAGAPEDKHSQIPVCAPSTESMDLGSPAVLLRSIVVVDKKTFPAPEFGPEILASSRK